MKPNWNTENGGWVMWRTRTSSAFMAMAMRRIFWGFCRNCFLMSLLHYFSSRSDFGFEFLRRYLYSKNDSPLSPIREVADTESRLLNFLQENSLYRRLPAPVIRWVANSRIVESESCRLRVLPIRRVDDSGYRWVGESTTLRIGDTGSRYSMKKLIRCWFSALLTANSCLKRTNLAKNKPGM